MRTLVVNIYGGPGAGKSTEAAAAYSELKRRGRSVELVREYVKAWAWRGEQIRHWDELYIFAKQLREESTLYGKVDLIVTDRPLGMSVVYERAYAPAGTAAMAVLFDHITAKQQREGVHTLDLLMRREKEYSAAGRFESEQEALRIDALTREVFPNLVEVGNAQDVLLCITTKEQT